MENVANSFLMVIEPFDFDLKQQEVFHSDFGFVFASESEYFRDSLIRLYQECHKIRKNGFGPKIVESIRERMEEFARKPVKNERSLLEMVAMLFDIVYYTAVFHDKVAHLRKFFIIEGSIPKYFGYIGSKDYNSIEIIEKSQGKLK